MKRTTFIILAISITAVFAISLFQKNRVSNELEFELLGIQANHSLTWSVYIYGIKNDDGLDDPFIGAEHIRIVDPSGSRYCIFRPYDQTGYAGTPKSIWSPNGRYLVLSDGQQEGFVVYRTDELPSTLPGKPFFRAKVVWEGGYQPVHQFDRWISDEAFVFSTGANKLTKQYLCDLDKRELRQQQ